VTHSGTAANENLVGTGASDLIVAGQGNDTLLGNGGVDVLLGGEGDDTLAISDLSFQRVDGGNGVDTLRIDGSGHNLDLTQIADNKLAGIEQIDLSSSGANRLTLNRLEALNLSDTSNTLIVTGDHDDRVEIELGWQFVGKETFNGALFEVYTQDAAILKISDQVSVLLTIELSDLSAENGGDGTVGFVLDGGIDAGDQIGFSVDMAGDVNGDGFDDLVFGAYTAAPNGTYAAGEIYVVFGQGDEYPASIELNSLDGTNGFVLNGIDRFDHAGFSVGSAGDVNGDGFADVLIGARRADPNGINYAGETYVVFGKEGGFSAAIELSALDGTNGFVINGIDAGDAAGKSVSTKGDVNGDGFDDLVIGTGYTVLSTTLGANEAYVIFGHAGSFEDRLDLSSLDGTNGFVITGFNTKTLSTIRVDTAGDVNGDGLDDLVFGVSQNSSRLGYVVFGQLDGFSPSFDLSSLDGSNGFAVSGIQGIGYQGVSVSSAGDINGDGFDDLVIGAPGVSPEWHCRDAICAQIYW